MRRWMAFNGVGAAGFAVQLAVLAVLTHVAGLHYLFATGVAVETAILHNFLWHQFVTWRDRPAAGVRQALARLLRFHLLNGIISLGGNLALMRLLAGELEMPPLVANVLAVLTCSIVNFIASEVMVFKDSPRAKRAASSLTTAAIALAFALSSPHGQALAEGPAAADLRAGTLAAWNKYQEGVDRTYETAEPFFRHDAFKRDGQWRASARSGQVPMFSPERPGPDAAAIDVPDGRIHHWVGAVFVPGATLDRVLRSLRENAGRESESYGDVLASRLLARDGNHLRVFMKIERRAPLITVTYNTEHTVDYRVIAANRASSRSVATKIAELAEAGTQAEREKPPGRDSGFLWRLNAYWRYEQVPGGVLIECESVSLSRDIPFLLRPLLTGTVNGIAKDSLETTLRTLRDVLVRTAT